MTMEIIDVPKAADGKFQAMIEQGVRDGTIRKIDFKPDTYEEGLENAKERLGLGKQLKEYKPPASTWWTRSIIRAALRAMIGLVDDVAKGELFERLVASNVQELTRLVAGLRTDLSALQGANNALLAEHADTRRRLHFYELHNDALRPTYAKLQRMDEEAKHKAIIEAARQKRQDASNDIRNRLSQGEVLDCPACDGRGEVTNLRKGANVVSICEQCEGSGVIPNPEYTPPPEENHAPVSKASNPADADIPTIRLVREEKRLDERDGGGAISEEALSQSQRFDAARQAGRDAIRERPSASEVDRGPSVQS